MPKVGNKSFPYTAKGIDDAKKEKKRIASGGTPIKRKPKMIGGKWVEPAPIKKATPPPRNTRPVPLPTLPRKPRDPNRPRPVPMPRMPLDPNRVRPKPMPRFNAIPKPAKLKDKSTGPAKIIKPAKRRPIKVTPSKRMK